jgi:hypothetical protein
MRVIAVVGPSGLETPVFVKFHSAVGAAAVASIRVNRTVILKPGNRHHDGMQLKQIPCARWTSRNGDSDPRKGRIFSGYAAGRV